MKKVALVTGSSRGIGRAVAAELARDGYAVCINYYERKDKADELVALLRAEGREAIAVQADVSKRSEVNAMVAQCERELGKITLLVNNAGVAGQMQFQDITDEQWNRYLAVNLGGARNAIRAVLPALGNEFIMLLKDTSLITVIGGKEMVYAAQAIYGRTYEQMFPLIGIACIYLLLVMVFSWLQSLLERRLRQSDRR